MLAEKIITKSIEDSASAICQLRRVENIAFIQKTSQLLAATYQKGNKVIIAGNGGSLCDAAHFAEELTGFFRKKRKALPAIAITESGHITCVGNDVGFDHIFSRAIEAHGKPEDVFIGLTTSGNSKNITAAFKEATERGLKTVAFLGKDGGVSKGMADLELIIEGFATAERIQEAHMTAMHILIEVVEEILFYSKEEKILFEWEKSKNSLK